MDEEVEALFRPPGEEPRKRFPVRVWYFDIVVGDKIDLLPEALDYYYRAVLDGEQYIVPRGHLETLLAGSAGITYFYEKILDDASMILRAFEEKLKKAKARRYVWLLSPEGQKQFGKLREKDMPPYVEADDHIESLMDDISLVAAAEHSLKRLVERLVDRGIKLSLISKLREAGQTEVFIDAGHANRLFED